jgi:hypothetical protein
MQPREIPGSDLCLVLIENEIASWARGQSCVVPQFGPDSIQFGPTCARSWRDSKRGLVVGERALNELNRFGRVPSTIQRGRT